MSFESQYANSC